MDMKALVIGKQPVIGRYYAVNDDGYGGALYQYIGEELGYHLMQPVDYQMDDQEPIQVTVFHSEDWIEQLR